MTNGITISLEALVKCRVLAKSIKLHSVKRTSGEYAGIMHSPFRGRGVDFAEVRAYQAGDDIRLMDWRVTARTGKPHTKVFQEERERPVVIITDLRASMRFGTRRQFKSVLAAKASAILAWAGAQQGNRVGSVIIGDESCEVFVPKATERGVLPQLKAIAERASAQTQVKEDDRLVEGLTRASRLCHAGALVFILSDFQGYDKAAQQALAQLASRQQVIGLWVSDPLERELNANYQYAFTDKAGTHTVTVNGASRKDKKRYHEQFATFHASVSQTLKGMNVPLFDLTTEKDCAEQLSQCFTHRERAYVL